VITSDKSIKRLTIHQWPNLPLHWGCD